MHSPPLASPSVRLRDTEETFTTRGTFNYISRPRPRKFADRSKIMKPSESFSFPPAARLVS
jgi:hypothetical protein